MIFEISNTEIDSQTGAIRVFVYEDDGVTIIMLTEKLYEGDEKLELMMIFDSEDECDDGPQDG